MNYILCKDGYYWDPIWTWSNGIEFSVSARDMFYPYFAEIIDDIPSEMCIYDNEFDRLIIKNNKLILHTCDDPHIGDYEEHVIFEDITDKIDEINQFQIELELYIDCILLYNNTYNGLKSPYEPNYNFLYSITSPNFKGCAWYINLDYDPITDKIGSNILITIDMLNNWDYNRPLVVYNKDKHSRIIIMPKSTKKKNFNRYIHIINNKKTRSELREMLYEIEKFNRLGSIEYYKLIFGKSKQKSARN